MNPFASRLKALRSRYELTSQQMASFIGLSGAGSYSTLENGKNPPSCKTLVRTARAFAVDLDYLVGRTQKPYEEELLRIEEKDLFPLVVNLRPGRNGTPGTSFRLPPYRVSRKRIKTPCSVEAFTPYRIGATS